MPKVFLVNVSKFASFITPSKISRSEWQTISYSSAIIGPKAWREKLVKLGLIILGWTNVYEQKCSNKLEIIFLLQLICSQDAILWSEKYFSGQFG